MKYKLSLVIFFSMIGTAKLLALPIDSTLTAQILGSSDSKKTILLNKGSDDGLRKGNHAKLSIPGGVIARAVVTRLSPARSVWSIYRFYKQDKVMNNIAIRVKIASPTKLTTDETKSLGILAEKYGKKDESILPDAEEKEKKRQKRLEKSISRKTGVTIKAIGIDYSALDDNSLPSRIDPAIKWSGLDGQKDHDAINPNIDYSKLK